MGDMEDRLNSLLSDPGAMENIAKMARQLMGGESPEEQPPVPPEGTKTPPALGKILGKLKGGGSDDRKTQLLRAMKPYLKEERQKKMDRALKLAKMAHLAEIAMKAELGGEEDGL